MGMNRRGRAARLREAGVHTLARVSAVPWATVAWNDLACEEQAVLRRLNRGHCDDADTIAGTRLIVMELAVLRPSGLGITQSGRELVTAKLLGLRDHEALNEPLV